MKQPDESPIGIKRKSLPTGKARKLRDPGRATSSKQVDKKTPLGGSEEQEMARVFEEK